MDKNIVFESLREMNQKSKELKSEHCIKIEGLISPESYTDDSKTKYMVFGQIVKVFDDDKTFGPYCKFSVDVPMRMKKDKLIQKSIRIYIQDKKEKTITKKPIYYSDINNLSECVLFEWSGDGFYDCNRTYFHFEDDKDNETGEGDFMHYKCKLIKTSVNFNSDNDEQIKNYSENSGTNSKKSKVNSSK